MNKYEFEMLDEITARLISLGYPKSSLVIDNSTNGKNQNDVIFDLNIKDIESDALLAIVNIKKNLSDLGETMKQMSIYARTIDPKPQMFISTYVEGILKILKIHSNGLHASEILEFPRYAELLEIHKNKINKNIEFKNKKMINYSSVVASIAAMITIALSASALYSSVIDPIKINISKIKINENLEEKDFLKEMEILKNQVNNSNLFLDKLSRENKDISSSVAINILKSDIEKINKKLEFIESAISIDPMKSIALPMMRKDMDNFEKNFKEGLSQAKSEIDRSYDLIKWLIGLVITIAVSVLGIAASSYFAKKDA